MRRSYVSKRPFERGCGGFSAAKKLEPDKISSMDDLLKAWEGHESAKSIIRTAKQFGIGLERLGKGIDDINDNIGSASLKFSRKDRGYCEAVYGVASIIIAQNDLDTAKWLINEMASKIEEKEVKRHFINISDIMDEISGFGLRIEQLGRRNESTADEIVRSATNRRYRYAKNSVAIIMMRQKAEGYRNIISNRIVPNCNGSELFELMSYIRGRAGNKKMDEHEAGELIKKISKRLDRLWMKT